MKPLAAFRRESAPRIASRHRTLSLAFAVACALAAAFAADIAKAQDGTPDASWAPRNSAEFGVTGLIEDTFNLGGGGTYNGDMTATAVAVQADGKVVVAGFGWNTFANTGDDQNACVVRRYLANGDNDTSFGENGIAMFNASASGESSQKLDCYFNSLALQPDGAILAAGQLTGDVQGALAIGIVFRLDTNGAADLNFGGSGYVRAGVNFTQVLVAPGGNVYATGAAKQTGFNDTDFYLAAFDAGGNSLYTRFVAFDEAGGDLNDSATSAVLETWGTFSAGAFHSHERLYVAGLVDNAAYSPTLAHHSCGVAAFDASDGSELDTDTSFGGGVLTWDFPVGLNDTDTLCRTATRRPGLPTVLGPTGIVVGGERYFVPTAGGLASMYALAEISPNGTMTRHDDFAFFEDALEPGAFNSIFAMAWDDIGKLVVVGYAGLGANGNAAHAPSDMGLRRFNADYSSDTAFGTFTPGTEILSLDDAGGPLLPAQREWATALALDPTHARAIVVGERSPWLAAFPNKYYWMLGAVHDGVVAVSDRIFANGFD